MQNQSYAFFGTLKIINKWIMEIKCWNFIYKKLTNYGDKKSENL